MRYIFCPTFSSIDLEPFPSSICGGGGRLLPQFEAVKSKKKGGKAELRIQSVPLQKSDWSGRSTFVRQFILKFWQSLANTPATAVEEVVAKAAAASSDRSFQQIQAYSSSSSVPLCSSLPLSLAPHYRSFSSIRFQYDICCDSSTL